MISWWHRQCRKGVKCMNHQTKMFSPLIFMTTMHAQGAKGKIVFKNICSLNFLRHIRKYIGEFLDWMNKGAFTRCDKTDATCNKIALCKRAYLCDMRLLHAVAGKLQSSNFLATIACSNKPVYIVRFWRTSHGCMSLSHRVNAPLIKQIAHDSLLIRCFFF